MFVELCQDGRKEHYILYFYIKITYVKDWMLSSFEKGKKEIEGIILRMKIYNQICEEEKHILTSSESMQNS